MADPVVDPTWLRRTAAREDFNQDYFERAFRLAHLLAEVGRHPRLSQAVALKGGTCINLFHADVPRLSVDLDLNYVGAVDRAGMEQGRDHVLTDVRALVERFGYRFERETASYISWKGRFVYVNAHGSPDSVKADLNVLMRVPLYGVDHLPLPDLFGIAGEVPCLALEDVYGGKLKTVPARGEPRDVYDAARFLSDPPDHDPAKLRKAALFYLFMDDATLASADLRRARGLTVRDYEAALYPTLRADDRPTPDDHLPVVMPYMEALLALRHDEEAFGARLLEHAYEPQLLFGDAGVNPAVERHPAGEWRRRHPRARAADAGERWRPRTCPDCRKEFRPMTDAMWRHALAVHLSASKRHAGQYTVAAARARVRRVLGEEE